MTAKTNAGPPGLLSRGSAFRVVNAEQDHQAPTGTLDDLDYMHARYYKPVSAERFFSVDPGRDADPKSPQSWNLYVYVRNNPLKFTDPTGTMIDEYTTGTTANSSSGFVGSPGGSRQAEKAQDVAKQAAVQQQAATRQPIPTSIKAATSMTQETGKAPTTEFDYGLTVQGAFQLGLNGKGVPIQVSGDLTLSKKGTLSLHLVVQPGVGTGVVAGGYVALDSSHGASGSAIGLTVLGGRKSGGGVTLLNYGDQKGTLQGVFGFGAGIAVRAVVLTVPVVTKEWTLWH